MKKKETNLCKMLKYLVPSNIEGDQPLYIYIYYDVNYNDEGDLHMKVDFNNFYIDQQNNCINIYDEQGNLKYILPFNGFGCNE